MPVFSYKAIDLDAGPVAGTILADTPRAARDMLRERGLTVSAVSPMEAPRSSLRMRGGRLGYKDQRLVVELVHELGTLLSAGIPLLSGLQTLTKQHKGRFQGVVQQLTDDVAAGTGLAEAMSRQGAYFDEMCTSIIRVGENTGSLELALKRLADFKEKAQALRSRVTTALIYPGIIFCFGLVVCAFLMTYVVPQLLTTMTQANKPLPAVTAVVKGASDFLLTWWWALAGGVALAVAGFNQAMRHERGRMVIYRAVLRMPLLGELVRMENTSRFSVVLAALLRSGLQFVEAIRITRGTIRNRVFRKALDEYEAAVAAGRDVSEPLAASGVFSPLAVQIVAVGQQAGMLEDMLEQLSGAYDQRISTATGRLTAVLEPLLIITLAILIGFVVFATMLPILEMSNVL